MTTPYPQNLSAKLPMVNDDGTPSAQFQRFWQTSIARLVGSINAAAAAQTSADTAQDQAIAALAAAVVAQTTADAALTEAVADDRYVQQSQAARPTYSAYAGQTISAAYVQAEAQATDDAVKALSTAFVAALTALNAAKVLS